MSIKRIPYSEREMQIITEEISKSPQNIAQALKNSIPLIYKELKVKRKLSALLTYYQRVIKHKSTELFSLKSEHVTHVNRKVISVKKDTSISLKNEILYTLIKELSPEQKTALIKDLISSL